MNRREEYMKALRREPVQGLTWAPNFDHWYTVNTAAGTMPEEYRGLSCNDLIRAVGGTIWRRVSLVHARADDSVKMESEQVDDKLITYFHTPVGTLRTVHQQAPDSSKAWFLVEHRVKTYDDLRPFKYLIEATHYEMTTDAYEREVKEVGDDGIILAPMPCVPFIEFAKMDVGYQEAYYLLADYPEEVDEILALYQESFLEAFRLAAKGPVELLTTGDNMDQLTCPPEYFLRYARPFYQEIGQILHAGSKIAQGHWCGKLDQLIPYMSDCGLDVVEAVTPKPMSNVDMRAMMDVVEGKLTIQGGIPSVFMCDEGCTRDELVQYIRDLLAQVGHCRGFILGMGDNVPSSADFARVKMVSEIVEEYNRTYAQVGV
ncbi:MAG: uroporphyrinogen decarboxylase family protein [Armatimonadota bacterium]